MGKLTQQTGGHNYYGHTEILLLCCVNGTMTSLRKRLRGGSRSRVNAINVNSRKTLFVARDDGERDFYDYINVPYFVNNNNIIYKNRIQTTSKRAIITMVSPAATKLYERNTRL